MRGQGRTHTWFGCRCGIALALLFLCLAPYTSPARAADASAAAAQASSSASLGPFVREVAKLTTSATVAGDKLGYSVSVSGDTAVVGIPYDTFIGTESGTAYVFTRNQGGADAWSQTAELNAGLDAAANDHFGTSVAISGDTIVVGAPHNDDDAENEGSAYVFERNTGGKDQWGFVAKLNPGGYLSFRRFGQSVAISGDTIVVGAPYDNGGECESGAAFVFRRNHGGTDNWGEVKRLVAGDATQYAWLGYAVAVSGDQALVGAPRAQVGGDETGAAYVFERNTDAGDGGGTADDWGQVRKLTAGDAALDDRFGSAVGISGDMAVVGAEQDDVERPTGLHLTVTDAGSAYVFERNRGGPELWGQAAKLVSDDLGMFDYLGYAVGISGDAVVVSAPQADSLDGLAYLFERNSGGPDNWGLVQKFAPDTSLSDIRFGLALAISGDTIVGGAPYDDEKGEASGAAYVFVRSGVTWHETGKGLPDDPELADYSGFAVAISGDTMLVGTPGEDDAGSSSGAAYVMERNNGGAEGWGEVQKLVSATAGAQMGKSVSIDVDVAVIGAPGANEVYIHLRNQGGPDEWGRKATKTLPMDDFGAAVAVSGDTIVVGAPGADHSGKTNVGAAYVFERNYTTPNQWGLTTMLSCAGWADAGDHFGNSVAISGDTIVVGAYYDGAGAAYRFERQDEGASGWSLMGRLVGSDPGTMDWFGHSVSISGDVIVVGAPFYYGSAGAAYVFERNWGGSADAWGQVQELTASDAGSADHYFGWTVSVSVDTAVVGSYAFDVAGTDSGAAYVFERNEDGADAWGEAQKLVPAGAEEADWFGHSVAISGRQVAVGSPYDDDGASAAGSTYVFRLDVARVYLPLVLRAW
jgi:hypothetical protein